MHANLNSEWRVWKTRFDGNLEGGDHHRHQTIETAEPHQLDNTSLTVHCDESILEFTGNRPFRNDFIDDVQCDLRCFGKFFRHVSGREFEDRLG
jgi:hypothetical protein